MAKKLEYDRPSVSILKTNHKTHTIYSLGVGTMNQLTCHISSGHSALIWQFALLNIYPSANQFFLDYWRNKI